MKKKLQGLLVFAICMTFTGLAFAAQPIDKDPLVVLGKLVYEDTAFSANGNQSCQSCHHPKARFSDPENRISPMYRPVSEGSHDGLFGGRNAPPAAYAAYSPIFQYDDIEGLFIGGLFWDGRATGILVSDTGGLGAGPTYDPLADQAKGPFGNPVEMALADPVNDVVYIVSVKYPDEYNAAFPDTPLTNIDLAYNNIALAISAFEKSPELNRFQSKFDRFRDEQGDVSGLVMVDPDTFVSEVYTLEEAEGLALFNDPSKGNCAACHPTADFDNFNTPSVFTDFSYDNLGIPVNPIVADLAGPQPIDYGLGARVAELEAAFDGKLETKKLSDGLRPRGRVEVVVSEQGKFKVSSLRNIARTAPYGHNGFFPTLYDIVHFYNTRDVLDWPAPEVPATVNNVELGDLGLTFEEEQKIVVFLETLTDDEG